MSSPVRRRVNDATPGGIVLTSYQSAAGEFPEEGDGLLDVEHDEPHMLHQRPPEVDLPPSNITEIVISMSKRYEKNRLRALPRDLRRPHGRAKVETAPTISEPTRTGNSWVVEVDGPLFKNPKLPRIPGAPGSSWWTDGTALVKVSSPRGTRKVSSMFEFKNRGVTYKALCVTRTTALRQEVYSGATQWMVIGGDNNTALIIKFNDPDWDKYSSCRTPVVLKEDRARRGSRLKAVARMLSAWRRRVMLTSAGL